jgi:hypothetical protein
MPANLDRYKKDLERLAAMGDRMRLDLFGRCAVKDGGVDDERKKLYDELNGTFERDYQVWYTEAHAVIRQLLPDRLSEFQELYRGDGRRKKTDIETYRIQDWLNGVRAGIDAYTGKKYYDDFALVSMRFGTQVAILKAVNSRFESSLHDIRQLVQADLFDSELDAARELAKNGFLRPAGAVAGVVLEKHLGQVALNHALAARKQRPTISNLNDLLKDGGVLDVPAWRNVQRLGDLRNLCDHNKHRDPTAAEISELVDGVEKISKTVF